MDSNVWNELTSMMTGNHLDYNFDEYWAYPVIAGAFSAQEKLISKTCYLVELKKQLDTEDILKSFTTPTNGRIQPEENRIIPRGYLFYTDAVIVFPETEEEELYLKMNGGREIILSK